MEGQRLVRRRSSVWREQYKGFENFKFDEFAEICFGTSFCCFFRGSISAAGGGRNNKYFRSRLVSLASSVGGMKLEDFRHWGKNRHSGAVVEY